MNVFKKFILSFFLLAASLYATIPCSTAFKILSEKITDLPPIIVLSGASGAGKTTVLEKVLSKNAFPLRSAIGVTTRSPRPGEIDGKNYHFWTKEKFENAVKKDEFIEHAEVHGNFYGTLKSEVDSYRKKGTGVVLVIDVQGGEHVKKLYPESVGIFVKPSKFETIEQRLRGRGTETEANIQKRLNNAKSELAHEKDYDHTLINDDLDTATNDLSTLIQSYYPKKK